MRKAKQTLVSLWTWLNYIKSLFVKLIAGTWARRITHVYCVVALRKSSASFPVIYMTRTFHIPILVPTFILGGQSPSCDVAPCHTQTPQNESTFYQSLSGHVLKNKGMSPEIEISQLFHFINLLNINETFHLIFIFFVKVFHCPSSLHVLNFTNSYSRNRTFLNSISINNWV